VGGGVDSAVAERFAEGRIAKARFAKEAEPLVSGNNETPPLEADFTTPPTKIVIIASHQSRILCELNRLKLLENPKYNGKSIRFKNGAVLKVMIRDNFMEVTLVHDGELTENKSDHKGLLNGTKPYYVMNKTDIDAEVRFTTKSVKFPAVENLDIYLIRHGEGDHNVTKWYQKPVQGAMYRSADLTDEGKEQAKSTGGALKLLLEATEIPITLASSDISRAVNTMNEIRTELNMTDRPIHIIQCSHEISNKKPPCDGFMSGAATGENDGATLKFLTEKNTNTIAYLKFYNNNTRRGQKERGGMLTRTKTHRCSNTTMFDQIINVAMADNNPDEDGGDSPGVVSQEGAEAEGAGEEAEGAGYKVTSNAYDLSI